MADMEVRNEGYSERAFEGWDLGEVSFDSLRIRNQPDIGNFGPTDLYGKFCMLLHSTLTVAEGGTYEFALTSDDGSVLWLDSVVVIDNDGPHRMRIRRETRRLSPGTYAAQLWYYNGFPANWGLELSARLVEAAAGSGGTEEAVAPIVLSAATLFESGEYELTELAYRSLDTLCARFEGKQPRRLSVTGHTDAVGAARSNDTLSLRRAEAVSTYLRNCLGTDQAGVSVKGEGSRVPVADNNSERGRAANRRVEVSIEL